MTASTRLLVVLNPHAGRGAAAAAWAAAEPILRAADCTPQLVETKRPGHARELFAGLGASRRNGIRFRVRVFREETADPADPLNYVISLSALG